MIIIIIVNVKYTMLEYVMVRERKQILRQHSLKVLIILYLFLTIINTYINVNIHRAYHVWIFIRYILFQGLFPIHFKLLLSSLLLLVTKILHNIHIAQREFS